MTAETRTSTGRESPEATVHRLTREGNEALDRGDKYQADKIFAERSKLNERLHGDEPIIGSGGRSL